jgi:NADPH:quinone reductase-like Zn-dependent oxidoreductase
MPAIPKTMRAAAIDRVGGPEVLTLHELPVPELDAREVLIRIHTAGVGSWDAEMRSGWWPGRRPRFPIVLGSDGSGTVVQVGSRVRSLKVGDRVYAYSIFNPKGGFYAEYVAVSASNVSRVPKGLDLKQAGAIGTTGLTALQGVEQLELKKGQPVIIVGASGGVGTLAVQFARKAGAKTLAVASGKDGVRLVKRLGADATIDGKRADIEEAARKFAPGGVAAVLAFSGGEALDLCVAAVRPGGRVAWPHGVDAPKKRRGVELIAYNAEPGVAAFKRLDRAVQRASLNVPIAAAFRLADARKAHERVEAGHVLGKVVLRVS